MENGLAVGIGIVAMIGFWITLWRLSLKIQKADTTKNSFIWGLVLTAYIYIILLGFIIGIKWLAWKNFVPEIIEW